MSLKKFVGDIKVPPIDKDTMNNLNLKIIYPMSVKCDTCACIIKITKIIYIPIPIPGWWAVKF